MSVDTSCSYCAREPSHPQVRHRFAYAAYYRAAAASLAPPRTYVAALCTPCHETDERKGTGAARNRFLANVRHWSGLGPNRGQIVRLLEHPEGVTGDEREGDSCFRAGELHSYRALAAKTS